MKRLGATALGAVALLLAGCGSADQETPATCLQGPAGFESALRAAPGAVELKGGVAISSCLTRNQSAGDLTRVGSALLVTTTRLNTAARAAPDSPAPLRLGYLIGAVRRGAQDTDGIHATLVSRLEAAAAFSPGGDRLPTEVRAAYRAGVEAGSQRG